jgi:Zn-dependent peptidase ImmA (M78 family)
MLVKEAAKQAAIKTLAEHWDFEFPVDPVAIAQAKGLEVRFAELKNNVSGAIVAKAGQVPVILVEARENYGRQMFTAAHELGHYAERENAGDHEYSFVESRGRKYDLHEFYADEFAGNLLMPEAEFKSKYKQLKSVNMVAAYFAVSPPAVKKRAQRLGL